MSIPEVTRKLIFQAHKRASVHHQDWNLSREVVWEVQDHDMHLRRADIVSNGYVSKDLFVDVIEKLFSV